MANLSHVHEDGSLANFQKPIKGSAWLDAKKRAAEHKRAEDAIMAAVRKLDGQCRYPLCEHRAKKPRLEAGHKRHRGMGGNPTLDRTTPEELMTFCFIDHAAYDRGRRHWRVVRCARGGLLAFAERRSLMFRALWMRLVYGKNPCRPMKGDSLPTMIRKVRQAKLDGRPDQILNVRYDKKDDAKLRAPEYVEKLKLVFSRGANTNEVETINLKRQHRRRA